MPAASSSTTLHCPLADQGGCHREYEKVLHCSVHQDVCDRHSMPYLKTDTCQTCRRELSAAAAARTCKATSSDCEDPNRDGYCTFHQRLCRTHDNVYLRTDACNVCKAERSLGRRCTFPGSNCSYYRGVEYCSTHEDKCYIHHVIYSREDRCPYCEAQWGGY